MPNPAFPHLYVIDHPLIAHKLSHLRDCRTGMTLFRQLLREISLLLGYEITRRLPLTSISLETPLAKTQGHVLKKEGLVLVPVLRAGLGMTTGLLDLVPFAQVGHIGLYRDPKTILPISYLTQLPTFKGQFFLVLDPMVATGHSAVAAVQTLIEHGVPESQILFLALVVSPEGMTVFQEHFPKIPLYTAALDEKLNDKAYILPGLGDAGDRLFGTF